MKTKTLLTVIILSIILASCAPASISTPTETQILPTATVTLTPVPPTPTITPTPTPENLADTKDLQIWVEQYVHAYGGKVMVNSVEMDASQLTDSIRKNAESYIQVKETNGVIYSFLMVNDTPLAIQGKNGKWQEATIKEMANLAGLHINITGIYDEKDLMKKYFTSFTSSWAFMWNIYRPDSKEKYNFDRTDYDIKFAQEIGADNVIINSLVWGYRPALPSWLVQGSFTNDELTQIMTEHIEKTVSRYKGKVNTWFVVNEPLGSSRTTGNSSFWGDKLGNDVEHGITWIGLAFQLAHQSDPDAKLILNDTCIEFGKNTNCVWSGDKSSEIYSLVKTLKEKEYPIDGIGFQMHLSGYEFLSANQKQQKMQQLAEQIKRYKDIGVDVSITELDICMTGIAGTPQERYEKQFDIYKTVIDTAIKSGVIDFAVFGVKDEQSWLISTYGIKDCDPSLFNNQGIKPAYYAVVQAVFENIH